MSAHLAGAKHATQVVKLCKLLRVPDTRITWRKYVLLPTKAQHLMRGNVVLYLSDALAHEVEQGIVSGLTRHGKSALQTHVVLTTHKEVILMGVEKVLRVLDGDNIVRPAEAKSTTPRTSPTSPTKARFVCKKKANDPVKNLTKMFASEGTLPTPAYTTRQEQTIAANRAMFESIFPELLSEKPLPKKKVWQKPRSEEFALLETEDIAFVVQSLLFHNRTSHRYPMPYTFLPGRIVHMQKNDTEGWECGILNTDAGQGIHWIVAMWNKTPELVLWEMYDRSSSCMEDVVVYLESKFRGTRVTRHYTGMQPPDDFRKCGYNSAFTQLHIQQMLSCGIVPREVANIPAPPVGWYDFVRELLRIRDLQLRVRGKVSHQTAAELGLVPSFRDAMESGRFSFVAMKRQLAAEMQALHQVLLCVLISWLLCVLGGLCLTVLTVWHVNGLANSSLGDRHCVRSSWSSDGRDW
jgi:hypothetical protein